jgi:CxxC motif-containing protein (DUF1111 family)
VKHLAAAAAAVGLTLAAAAALAADGLDGVLGKALFDRLWVAAPSSTLANDGLGPMFNARGCGSCHPRGGAARIEDGDATPPGIALRLDSHQGLGRQLQTSAVPGLAPEGTLAVTGFAEDGTAFIATPAMVGAGSLRAAPSLRGRGAIERVDEAAVLALADPDDRDGDGISGRARLVEGRLGRYGWKAEHADLESQVAGAFLLDIGMSTPRFPEPFGDCGAADAACRALPDGEDEAFDGREISGEMVRLVASYVASLDAPANGAAPGATLFAAVGCAACHVPELPAGATTVRLHSDLLLHDMGPLLDDGLDEDGAASGEWRTAPLIDMAPAPGRRYLHDGRAADVATAIAIHGGEALAARDAFLALDARSRADLVSYLEGL